MVARALLCGCQGVAMWLLECSECLFVCCYVVSIFLLGGCQGIARLIKCPYTVYVHIVQTTWQITLLRLIVLKNL